MGEKLQLQIRAGVIPALICGMLVRRRGIRIANQLHRSLVHNDSVTEGLTGGGTHGSRPTAIIFVGQGPCALPGGAVQNRRAG